MHQNNGINIELVKGTLGDYLIKDISNIVIGRFTITELDKDNKKCNVKLKFYRDNDYDLLVAAIKSILRAIFKDGNIFKANFLVSENFNLKAFVNLGFTLEAIFSDNLFVKGISTNELSFGINRYEYNSLSRVSITELVGNRIVLRNFTPDNAGELLEYYLRNKQHLEKFEPRRDNNFYTIEEQKDILLESYRQLINGTSYDFGIYKNEKLIGKIKLSNVVYGVFKNAMLGYSMDKDFQGQGYMKEAVTLIVNHCKKDLGLHRIEASVLGDNKKSQSVLKSCGFKELGISEKYLFINGQWSDHKIFYKVLHDY